MPGETNPQAYNRYSYTLNDPIRYTDPSGHDVCNEEGYCFGNGGKKYRSRARTDYWNAPGFKTPKITTKIKGGEDSENASDFLSNLAYGADIAGVVLADMEAITVDTIGILVIAEGCMTGVGCLPAIGTAGFMDYAISSSSPLGLMENTAAGLALLATAGADYQAGMSYIKSDKNKITVGIGQDTVVSLVNLIAGTVPEANYDAWISRQQLEYDNRRRLGELPAVTMFQFNIPRITIAPPLNW